MLAAEPDNAVAAHGLDEVGGAYAAQARQALDAGNATVAAANIDKLASLLPRYGDLPALRAAQAEGFAAAGQEVVVTAGVPFGTAGTTNALRVASVK